MQRNRFLARGALAINAQRAVGQIIENEPQRTITLRFDTNMVPLKKPLLFSLPEYDRAFAVFVRKATDDMINEKEPLLKGMKRVKSGEVTVTQNTAPDGTVVSNDPVLVCMPFTFNIEAVIRGDIDEQIGTAIDASAEAGRRQIIPKLLDYVARVSDAFGNRVDVNGRPMSHDLLLDFIERVPIEFDESGGPDLASYMFVQQQLQDGEITARTFRLTELMQLLPPMTDTQRGRFADIIERKQQENSARRRHRQLH